MPISINSGKILLSDPSYSPDDIETDSVQVSVKKGQWKTYIEEDEFDCFGWKVIRIMAIHTDHTLEEIVNHDKTLIKEISVDSGFAGIYDNNSSFLDTETGMTSKSGFGNGSYNTYGVDINNETIFVEIEFINDEIITQMYKHIDRSFFTK
jgi:hypothetical protein